MIIKKFRHAFRYRNSPALHCNTGKETAWTDQPKASRKRTISASHAFRMNYGKPKRL